MMSCTDKSSWVVRAAAATPMYSHWLRAWAFNLLVSTPLAVLVCSCLLITLPHPYIFSLQSGKSASCASVNTAETLSTCLVHLDCMALLKALDGMQVSWHVACPPTPTAHPTLAQQPTQADSEMLQ